MWIVQFIMHVIRRLILFSLGFVKGESNAESIINSALDKSRKLSFSFFRGIFESFVESYLDDNSDLFAKTFGLTGFNIFKIINPYYTQSTRDLMRQLIQTFSETNRLDVFGVNEAENAGYTLEYTIPLSVLAAAVYSYGSLDFRLTYIAKVDSSAVRIVGAGQRKNDSDFLETTCGLSFPEGSSFQIITMSNGLGSISRIASTIVWAGAVVNIMADDLGVHAALRIRPGGGYAFIVGDGIQQESSDTIVVGLDSVNGLFVDEGNGDRIYNVSSIVDLNDGKPVAFFDETMIRFQISSVLVLRIEFDPSTLVLEGLSGDLEKLAVGRSIDSESVTVRRLLDHGTFVSSVAESLGVEVEIVPIDASSDPPSVDGQLLTADSKDAILSSLSSSTGGENIVVEGTGGVVLESLHDFQQNFLANAPNANRPLQLIEISGETIFVDGMTSPSTTPTFKTEAFFGCSGLVPTDGSLSSVCSGTGPSRYICDTAGLGTRKKLFNCVASISEIFSGCSSLPDDKTKPLIGKNGLNPVCSGSGESYFECQTNGVADDGFVYGCGNELTKSESYGGYFGVTLPFSSEYSILQSKVTSGIFRLKAIYLWQSPSLEWITGIACEWQDGSTFAVGEGGFSSDTRTPDGSLIFQTGEYIADLIARTGSLVDHIEIVTNRGRRMSAGRAWGGDARNFGITPGTQVVGFAGGGGIFLSYTELFVHNIRLLMAPAPITEIISGCTESPLDGTRPFIGVASADPICSGTGNSKYLCLTDGTGIHRVVYGCELLTLGIISGCFTYPTDGTAPFIGLQGASPICDYSGPLNYQCLTFGSGVDRVVYACTPS